MIQKKIHYIWMGGKPLTVLAKKCITSWKKFCPDFEIIEWNESNFDVTSNLYCNQAFESKKWAFVSDYVRLKILFDHGGIYMDTDVEVIKPLGKFLHLPAFSGFEDGINIPTGIIASCQANLWVKKMLSYYDNIPFLLDNKPDLTTNVISITKMTKEMYPDFRQDNSEQHFKEVSFFPKDYFCPLNGNKELNKTERTHTIHWFAGSWLPAPTFWQRIKNLIKKVIGTKNTQRVRAVIKNKH